MTLNKRVLKRVHSPLKSPKRSNTSLRKKALIKQWNSEVQFGNASKANLKVVVRVRPQSSREIESNAKCIVKLVDEHMMVFDPKEEDDEFFFRGVRQRTRDLNKRQNKEQKFAFERVFGEDSTNQQIFEETTRDIVETLLNGYNCSVFAYGATGAGKTFTMLGKPECPGITFLTLMELYKRIEEQKEEKSCEVGISYLEVYNETVRDLLQPGKALNVQETGQHVQVQGLSFHKPKNADDLMQMLACGNQNRSQHPTDANAESSRSHAVFQIFVRQQDRTANVKTNVSIAKLSMIDLAGSERGSATGFRGARFREGANINKSLLALGNCINALADGQKHIPYRDSKLTRLLKDSIGGNCRSVMIAAISPASTSFEDTFNTLRYANRAKTIKTTLKKNIMNVDQHVSQYVQIIDDLRKEICNLKDKVQKYEEKEKEWTSLKEASPPQQHDEEMLLEQQREYEARIASLETQIRELKAERGVALTEVCEEEAEVQRKLVEASSERKALRRELLQLESSQREVELKIHTCTMRLNRMKIIAFASYKLDKSISKCERTIRNLNIRLAQTTKLKQSVESKLSVNLEKLHAAQRTLNQWGPGSEQPSQASQVLIDKNETGLAYRDLHQLADYLRGMVKECVNEQNASEQLICQLLNTTRQFYVQLHASNQCTPEMEKYFESIVEKMDESKIIWADQHQEEKEDKCNLPEQPVIDIDRLTILPITSSVFISPAVTVEQKTFRRSIMKSSKSMSALPSVAMLAASEPSGLGLSRVPETSTFNSPSTPRIQHLQNTTPDSPVLSGLSVPPVELKALENTPASQQPISQEQQPSEKSELVSANSQAKDFGFVSMTEGCGISTVNVTKNLFSDANLDKTELLEDIQPVECSINATFAITPAKVLNTTVDVPSSLPKLNTTIDMSRLQNLNTTIDLPKSLPDMNTTIDMPTRTPVSSAHSALNPIIEVSKPLVSSVSGSVSSSTVKPLLNSTINLKSSNAVLNTTVDLPSKPSALNTTIDIPTKPDLVSNVEACSSFASTVSSKESVIPCKLELPATQTNLHKQHYINESSGKNFGETFGKLPSTCFIKPSVDQQMDAAKMSNNIATLAEPVNLKTASRKLFESGLDSTFCVQEPDLKKDSCMETLKSPEFSSYQLRRTTFEVPQDAPLIKPMETQTQSSELLMPPPTKVVKGILKKTPQKTPTRLTGKGTILGRSSGKTTPGKNITPGKSRLAIGKSSGGMRKSLSTSALAPQQANSIRGSSQMLINNKQSMSGLGAALRRTSSFLKGRGQPGNQENVPPSQRGFTSSSSNIYKDTVSSSARQFSQNKP